MITLKSGATVSIGDSNMREIETTPLTDKQKAEKIRTNQSEIAALSRQLGESGYSCTCYPGDPRDPYEIDQMFGTPYDPKLTYNISFRKIAIFQESDEL